MSCAVTRITHYYQNGNKDMLSFEVDEGEPVFILRAQDMTARDCVLIEDVKRIAAEFKAWRNKKVPD